MMHDPAEGAGNIAKDDARSGEVTLASWFATSRGRYVLAWEQAQYDNAVDDVFGFHAVQVGLPGVDFLRESRVPLRIHAGQERGCTLICAATQLPLASHSMDLVVLPHVLEFSEHPHQILREAERVLRPEGQIVISGFNPLSLWGMKRLLGVTFGRSDSAEFPWRGRFIGLLRLKDWLALHGEIGFKLNVFGTHNISNALAASAVAVALGVANADIARGLENFSGVKGRLQRKVGLNNAVLIDDTYNANPDSMKAAIDVLAQQSGKKILVLGDMGELGADARRLHLEIGAYAKAAGLKKLYCLGELSKEIVSGFGVGSAHYATPMAIAEAIKSSLTEDDVVLIKGSRFMKMERVVDLLEEKLNEVVLLEGR